MLIVVNPIRNLNHYSFATLHKLNYESNSINIVFILAYSLFIGITCAMYIVVVPCTYILYTTYNIYTEKTLHTPEPEILGNRSIIFN